jgi:hypothetical protein
VHTDARSRTGTRKQTRDRRQPCLTRLLSCLVSPTGLDRRSARLDGAKLVAFDESRLDVGNDGLIDQLVGDQEDEDLGGRDCGAEVLERASPVLGIEWRPVVILVIIVLAMVVVAWAGRVIMIVVSVIDLVFILVLMVVVVLMLVVVVSMTSEGHSVPV